MLISCINIKKSFTYDILKEANLTVAKGEKVALIGVNGSGKSTLFKIIIGEIALDSGEVIFKKNLSLGYLSQTTHTSCNTVYEELSLAFSDLISLEDKLQQILIKIPQSPKSEQQHLISTYDVLNEQYKNAGGYEYKSKLRGVINGLGFNQDQKISSLSGGQKTTLAMARLLLTDNDILLLDEPTNHLDISSVAWLETYLKEYKGAVVVISHDRYFINKLAKKIIEIEHGNTTTYNGNYDEYLAKKLKNEEITKKHYESNKQEIKKMEDSIALLKSFNREKSVKRARSKEKALDKIERVEAPTSPPKSLKLTLSYNEQSSNDVLNVENLSVDNLFKNIDLFVKRGEKIALIGPIGIGKSTIFKAILNKVQHKGNVIFGTKVSTSYYEQHQEEGLNINNSIFDEIHNSYPNLQNLQIRNTLAMFTFLGDDVFKKISSLSGGEKAKVLLAKIVLSGSNFLMLDEPTNHLDIISKEILEKAITDFTGTCLFISHDRYFINKTATKVIELSQQGITTYLGNYDYYLQKKKSSAENSNIDSKTISKKSNNVITWEQQKQNQQKARKLQNKLKSTEEKIKQTEDYIDQLTNLLDKEETKTNYNKLDKIFKEKEEKEEELLQLYETLEELKSVDIP